MTPEMVSWPLEPDSSSPSAAVSPASPTRAPVPSERNWAAWPATFERGRGLGSLRRGPLEPRMMNGLPWLPVCVMTCLAWLIAGRGMATAFIVVGFIGIAVLFVLRLAERGVSLLHLWDRRQAARRELGLRASWLFRRGDETSS